MKFVCAKCQASDCKLWRKAGQLFSIGVCINCFSNFCDIESLLDVESLLDIESLLELVLKQNILWDRQMRWFVDRLAGLSKSYLFPAIPSPPSFGFSEWKAYSLISKEDWEWWVALPLVPSILNLPKILELT